MNCVAIALGSNLGDRRAHLDFAVARLGSVLDNLRVSRYYQTIPVGVTGPQPLYLNAGVVGDTLLAPLDLLHMLMAIEREDGRERPHRNAPRTLDLDLVLFGSLKIDDPRLIVPHPRFRERRFVLEPLADVAPDMRDPVTGKTFAELLNLVLG